MYLYARQDKRICKMNEIASKEKTANFELLKEFAKAHPVIMADVLMGFLAHPDSRFGDTLLIFCDCVEHGRIVIK